jgi:hypothetical protein
LFRVTKTRAINGRIFVRKGITGKQGDFVVDSIEYPTQLLGVCDGLGNLNSVPSHLSKELLALLRDDK